MFAMQRRRTRKPTQANDYDRVPVSESREVRAVRKDLVARNPKHVAELMSDSATELLEQAASERWHDGVRRLLTHAPGAIRRGNNAMYLAALAAARKQDAELTAMVLCAWQANDGDLDAAVQASVKALDHHRDRAAPSGATAVLHAAVMGASGTTGTPCSSLRSVVFNCIRHGAVVTDGLAAHANHAGHMDVAADLAAALPPDQAAGEIIEDWVIVPDDERTGKVQPGTRIRNWIATADQRPDIRPLVATAAMAVPQRQDVWHDAAWDPDLERPNDTAVAAAAMDTFRRSSTLATTSHEAFKAMAHAGQRLLHIVAGMATTGLKVTRIAGRRASRLVNRRPLG